MVCSRNSRETRENVAKVERGYHSAWVAVVEHHDLLVNVMSFFIVLQYKLRYCESAKYKVL